MVLLIEVDKLFEERITLAIRAGAVLDGEQLQLHMAAPHLLHDRKVLRVESLDFYGQRVVIRAFTFLKLLVLARQVMLFGNCLDLLAHLRDLFMRELLEIELIFLLQLILNAGGIELGLAHEVLVHDTVIGKLQHEQRSCGKVSVLRIGIQPLLDLWNKFRILHLKNTFLSWTTDCAELQMQAFTRFAQ